MSGESHNPCYLEAQFQAFLGEYKRGQDRQIELLEEIAGQRKTLEFHDNAIKELKDRTRGLELKPGKMADKIFLIMVSSGTGVAGSIITALIMKHSFMTG